LPAERRDGRRQTLDQILALRGFVAGQQQLVLVQIAQRQHARQQQGTPPRGPQEGVLQAAAGAPGRQENEGLR
jgi:hypothetical protein